MIIYKIEISAKDKDMAIHMKKAILYNNIASNKYHYVSIHCGNISENYCGYYEFSVEITDNRYDMLDNKPPFEDPTLRIMFTVDEAFGIKYVNATGLKGGQPEGTFYDALHKNTNIIMKLSVDVDDSGIASTDGSDISVDEIYIIDKIYRDTVKSIMMSRMYTDGDIIIEEVKSNYISIECTEINGVYPLIYVL